MARKLFTVASKKVSRAPSVLATQGHRTGLLAVALTTPIVFGGWACSVSRAEGCGDWWCLPSILGVSLHEVDGLTFFSLFC